MYTILYRAGLYRVLAAVIAGFATLASASPSYYSNTTLTSEDGDLEVVVYLPVGVKPTEAPYYVSSRFDHSSMIGSMKRTSRQVSEDGQVTKKDHYLFGGELWRRPHNPQFPESGIGLASEFGVGDDGAFCFFRCGWDEKNDITNGLLGYQEARNGEPFLKIGVGALIKGSCASCDSTDNYRFNSPYEFAELPSWTVVQSTPDVVSMEHEARVNNFGYRLHKNVVLKNKELLVTTILTNLGQETFSTAWYSHTFFTCDGMPISDGYGLNLDIRGQRGTLFDEPGVIGSWAQPIQDFATVKQYQDHVTVDVVRPLEDKTRIKAEFTKDSASKGGFTLHGCGTSITTDFPEVMLGKVPVYAYNLYLEKGTFSPEPQLLIHLEPGATKSWTQRLLIEDTEQTKSKKKPHLLFGGLRSISLTNSLSSKNVWKLAPAFLVVFVALLAMLVTGRSADSHRRRQRLAYSQIPDASQS